MDIDDRFEKSPEPPPKVGDEQITFRLSGVWLTRWKSFMELSGNPSKSDVLRECLTLLFAAASTDGQGNPVQLVLRRKDEQGRDMVELDLCEYLNLPALQTYRAKRKQGLGKNADAQDEAGS